MFGLLLAGWFWAECQQSALGADLRGYAGDLRKVQTELDAGNVALARKLLDGTGTEFRNFEFEYLQARAARTEPGKAAPDLLRKIPKPDVDNRYAVLNEVRREVVYLCRDGSLRIHDLAALDSEPRQARHPRGAVVWSGAFSRDGKMFFSGHQNGEVLVWDAAKFEVRHTISLGEEWPVRELAAAPDGSACVAETKSALELWSLSGEKPRKVAKVGERFNFGEGLAFSPKGDLVATGGMFEIDLFDVKTGEKRHSMRHASYTMGIEFSPDGSRIASSPRGNVNKFLAVFEASGNEPLFNAGPFGDYVAGMAFTPDGKRIAATGCEKVLRIFDASTGEILLSLPRKECGAKPAFSRDGRLLGWNEKEGFLFLDLGQPPKGPEMSHAGVQQR